MSQVWLKVARWLGQPSRAADECGRPFSPAALLAAPPRSSCPPCRRPPRRSWAACSRRRSRLRRAARVACALRPRLARRRLARTRCLGAVAAAAAAAAACRRAANMRGIALRPCAAVRAWPTLRLFGGAAARRRTEEEGAQRTCCRMSRPNTSSRQPAFLSHRCRQRSSSRRRAATSNCTSALSSRAASCATCHSSLGMSRLMRGGVARHESTALSSPIVSLPPRSPLSLSRAIVHGWVRGERGCGCALCLRVCGGRVLPEAQDATRRLSGEHAPAAAGQPAAWRCAPCAALAAGCTRCRRPTAVGGSSLAGAAIAQAAIAQTLRAAGAVVGAEVAAGAGAVAMAAVQMSAAR